MCPGTVFALFFVVLICRTSQLIVGTSGAHSKAVKRNHRKAHHIDEVD